MTRKSSVKNTRQAIGKKTIGKKRVIGSFNEELAAIATFLVENPKTRLILAGYADSIGTEADNKKLSEYRAAAVRDFLIEKADIDASRITVRGFGEKDPVATNMYKAGRQQNRRVQGIIIGM